MQAKLLGDLRFTAEVNILLRCALQASLAVGVRRRPKKKKKKLAKANPKTKQANIAWGSKKVKRVSARRAAGADVCARIRLSPSSRCCFA